LAINPDSAKLLTGKDAEPTMLTYFSEVNHKAAFLQVAEHLRLTDLPKAIRTESQTELEAKVERLESILSAVAALDPEIVKTARAFVESNLGKYGSEIVLDKPLDDMDDNEILATYWKMIELAKKTKTHESTTTHV
jgi:hypothetical protein